MCNSTEDLNLEQWATSTMQRALTRHLYTSAILHDTSHRVILQEICTHLPYCMTSHHRVILRNICTHLPYCMVSHHTGSSHETSVHICHTAWCHITQGHLTKHLYICHTAWHHITQGNLTKHLYTSGILHDITSHKVILQNKLDALGHSLLMHS